MSLFVGNISRNVRVRDLEEEFEHFGKCEVNSKVSIHHILGKLCLCGVSGREGRAGRVGGPAGEEHGGTADHDRVEQEVGEVRPARVQAAATVLAEQRVGRTCPR